VLSVRMRAHAWLILLVSAPPTVGWREFLGLRSEPTGGVTPCSQFTPLSSSCTSSLMEVWHPNQIPLILGWGLPREINLNNHFSYLAHQLSVSKHLVWGSRGALSFIIGVKEDFLNLGRFELKAGVQTRFWEDTWLGNQTLKSQYPN